MKKENSKNSVKRYASFVVYSTISDCFHLTDEFEVARFSSKSKAISFARLFFYSSLLGFYLRDNNFVLDESFVQHVEPDNYQFSYVFSSYSSDGNGKVFRCEYDLNGSLVFMPLEADFYVKVSYVRL